MFRFSVSKQFFVTALEIKYFNLKKSCDEHPAKLTRFFARTAKGKPLLGLYSIEGFYRIDLKQEKWMHLSEVMDFAADIFLLNSRHDITSKT